MKGTKMNFFLRLFCWSIVLGISGCQGVHQHVLKIQSEAQCKTNCLARFDWCVHHCVDNCPACSAASTERSVNYFAKYVHERQVEAKKVMRELNSFRDPLQCRKVTCDCLSDLAICKMGCTGVIKKRLQTVPHCI
jgi:hypothetical protein